MKTYVALLLCLICHSSYAIPILNFYPKCEYKVIEEKSYQQKIVTKNWVNDTALTFSKINAKLQKKAKSLDADAILLVKRTVDEPQSNDFGSKLKNNSKFLKYQVQFISTCHPIDLDNLKPTPVNNEGHALSSAITSVSTIGFSQSTVISLGPSNTEPAKLSHRQVSLSNVYGIELGLSKKQFKQRFGEPSSVFYAQNETTILGYGRYHWFVFYKNLLVAITTNNIWFNQSMVNAIPFNNLFDDEIWEITNLGKQHQSRPLSYFNENTKFKVHNDASSLVVDTLKSNSQEDDTNRIVSSYTLKIKNFDLASIRFASPEKSKTAIQSFLSAQNNIYSLSAASELLNHPPIGYIKTSKTKTAYLFSPTSILTFIGNQPVEFEIGESAISQFKEVHWTWGSFNANQPLQEVEALLPDSAFTFQGKTNVNTENTSLTFLFNEEGNQEVLFKIVAKIFQTVD